MIRYDFRGKTRKLAKALKKATTEDEKYLVRLRIARANREFYRWLVKDLLQKSTWKVEEITLWLNTPKVELEGLSPKEGLNCLGTYKPYSRRTFEVLVKDLGLDLNKVKREVRKPKIEVTIEYDSRQ